MRAAVATVAVLVSVVLAGCSGDAEGNGTAATESDEDAALSVPEIVDEISASVVAVLVEQGGGTGVVFDPEGLIVTNAHVVGDLDSLEVVFADGEEVEGTVVAADPVTVAVVRVDRTDLPAATVVDVATELVEDGEVTHAFLGVVPAPVTPALAERFDLPVEEGVVVLELSEDGPAARAGMARGDIIVAIGDEEATSPADLFRALRDREPGDELALRS